jgi:hypothetical protein
MRKHITVILAAAVASLALLVPAGSAQAATPHHVKWCGQLTSNGYVSMTLKPGEVCSFWPVAVSSMWGSWKVVSSGRGSVCIGVIQYPPGWPNGKVLSPTGGNPATDPPRDPYDGRPPHPGDPGYPYSCQPWTGYMAAGDGLATTWFANNGFGAVYGQPVMINFSSATIKTQPGWSDLYGWINYYA